MINSMAKWQFISAASFILTVFTKDTEYDQNMRAIRKNKAYKIDSSMLYAWKFSNEDPISKSGS